MNKTGQEIERKVTFLVCHHFAHFRLLALAVPALDLTV